MSSTLTRAATWMSPLIVFAMAAPAAAQGPAPPVPDVAIAPVSLMLPNYNSVPIGEIAGLEAGAFIARVDDTSSGVYNPAGLAHAERTSLSGSAGAFQFGSVSPDAFTNVDGSVQQIPAMFGFVLSDLMGRPDWAGGFSIARVNAWNQIVEAEGMRAEGGLANRFRFSTDAAFDSWLMSLGVGFERSDRLRLGAALDIQYTSISRRQSIADQLSTATGLVAVTAASHGSASTTHLRATLGTQFEVTPSIRLGAVMRTPGWGIITGGSASLEGLAHGGATTRSVSFFEPDAETHHKLPFEFKAGVGWVGTRAEVEVDLLTYAGREPYQLFETGNTVAIVTDAGQGGAPVTVLQPYASPTVDSAVVVNVAVGGHYNLSSDGAWVLHGGYATDRSPVGEADSVFTRVHLQKMTAGLSLRTKLLLASLGFQYSAGRSDVVSLRAPENGSAFETTFKISSVGFVYSVAVLF